MASKVFLDANLILDLAFKREGYDQSKKIFELIINGSIKAFISSSILHIIGYFLAKAHGRQLAKNFILTLLADVTVIDMPHDTVIQALNSNMIDLEDALQYHTALHHRLDYFISSDKDFQKLSNPGLPVLSPKNFLLEIS